MKSFKTKTRKLLILLTLALFTGISAQGQRVITGTVYREGKIAAGVTVEANKSSETFMTSFDGKYKITISNKCKYLRFTFIDDSRKLDIEENKNNVIDFSFDGEIPTSKKNKNVAGSNNVDLRSAGELVKNKVEDFMNNYTLYDQFYKQKDYKSCLPSWRVLYNKYPKSSVNIYIHGVAMYESLIESAKDNKTQEAFVDTLINIYEQRTKYFDQKGYVLGREGTDLLKYKLAERNRGDEHGRSEHNGDEQSRDEHIKSILKEGYGKLKESIELEQGNSEVANLVVYMQATKRLFLMGELSKEDVAGNYQILSSIIDKKLEKDKSSKRYTTAKDLVDELFRTSGAADCEALTALYTSQLDGMSNDVDALKKMLRVLDKQNCTDGTLFEKASEKLYQLDPSPEAAFNMARLFVKKNNFKQAKEYYLNAISSETDKVLLSKYYYELGLFILAKEKDYKQSCDYAKKSIANNPEYGEAYILEGDIYAQYSKFYGKNDFEHQSLYWLAVDCYTKAKRVDPNVFAKANSRINTYKQYFPDKETLFFEGFQAGQKYTIGSWINKSTITRAK